MAAAGAGPESQFLDGAEYQKGRLDILDRFIRDALARGVGPAVGHVACTCLSTNRAG